MPVAKTLSLAIAFLALGGTSLPAQARNRSDSTSRRARARADSASRFADSLARLDSLLQRDSVATRNLLKRVGEPPVVTHHTITVRGQTIHYTARAGMLPIRNDTTGAVEGGVFYVAYTRDGASPATRPITFTFNGGPGSSTVWLHMGAFGPERVKLLADGSAPPPPYTYEHNPYTLLDQTDLVFLDPVGTGYSRATKPELGKRFWGLDEDIRAVGEFIRLYLTRYERWSSPKFLAGESYGTTRAAGLSGYLADHGIALNGIVLISTVLDFQFLEDSRGNDIGFIGFLPSFTATAWFHRKLPPELQSLPLDTVVARAEQYAETDYAAALFKGNHLSPADYHHAAEQLARFTGLSTQFVEDNNLRITQARFDHELLRLEREVTGRLDSRFTTFEEDPGAAQEFLDPSEASIRNSFTPVLNDYVRRVLGYRDEDIYYILGGGIGRWHFPESREGGYPSVTPRLERAFVKNPHMKLFVAMGYYDLATPYFAVEYTLSHLNVAPAVRKNITTDRFAAGHMVYIDDPSMKRLREDLSTFFDSAVAK